MIMEMTSSKFSFGHTLMHMLSALKAVAVDLVYYFDGTLFQFCLHNVYKSIFCPYLGLLVTCPRLGISVRHCPVLTFHTADCLQNH